MEELSIKQKSLLPITFFEYFDFPLQKEEWSRYKPKDVKRLPESILIRNGYLLIDKEDIDLIRTRKEREAIANRFWSKLKRWWWLFRWIPFLEMVAVTSTLSYDNVTEDSDIDLLMVAEPNRLWIARAFYSVLFKWFGLRVIGEKKAGRFSAEIWLDTDHLDISDWRLDEDYYFWFWTADVTCVAGRDVFKQFWRANDWLKKILPKAYDQPRKLSFDLQLNGFLKSVLEFLLRGKIGDWLESVVYKKQQKTIQRAKSEIGEQPDLFVSEFRAKTHYQDDRKEINEAIRKKLRKLD